MENEEVKGKYLPLGTIVLLKGGKKELMIMSYCVIPTGTAFDKNGEVKEAMMLDYGACPYPEGMVSSEQIFAFNHEQIEKVCFMGYETEQHKQLSKFLFDNADKRAELLEQIKKQRNNPANTAK